MDLPELARLARQMRILQKQYFGTRPEHRPPDLIARARAAERRLDAALDEIGARSRQPGLFDPPDPEELAP